jgi:starvation-inducible DNA-binding protein
MSTQVVKKLEKVLADSYVLMLKTQNFHWNVTGANFKSLHELFGEQYNELFTVIDELAERIRALGEKIDASMEGFYDISVIEDAEVGLKANEMLKELIEDQTAISKTISQCLKEAQKAGDEATADMMIGRLEVHDKNKWMLSASL